MIPKLFKHNADKQPQKRSSSMTREVERAIRQLWADAFSHNERIQDFQFIFNTKGTQKETSTFSRVYTHTECQLQSDFAAPCNIKDFIPSCQWNKKVTRVNVTLKANMVVIL